MNQPPLTPEALVERVLGFMDLINNKLTAMDKRLDEKDSRLHALEEHEALSVEWHHQHEAGPSHADIQSKIHNLEIKSGQLELRIQHQEEVENTRKNNEQYQQGVRDGMARSLSLADKIWVMILAAIPTILLLYTTFR